MPQDSFFLQTNPQQLSKDQRNSTAATQNADGSGSTSTEVTNNSTSASLSHTDETAPLAERMRPTKLSEIIGQDHLVGEAGLITTQLRQNRISSMMLWGPPGCGKTTLARIIAKQSNMHFETISAIFSGVAELKKIFATAKMRRDQYFQSLENNADQTPSSASTQQRQASTLLFVDEIHRFNKAQQDAFLPHLESGLITLIGATTENPSFSLNNALLSRCHVYILNRLDAAALDAIVTQCERKMQTSINLDETAKNYLLAMADGDGRYLIGMIETLLNFYPASSQEKPEEEQDDSSALPPLITKDILAKILQKRNPQYDSNEEEHYNLISALHKSVRGSDPDAALYWFCRMIEGGEDINFLARRILRMANEDIGLAAPQAPMVCLSAWQTYERLGSPEGELALAEALVYLATAPKSNAVYTAYKKARIAAKQHGSLPPPAHILNAPTKMMKDAGYGSGYIYDHDAQHGFSGQNYFPDELMRENYYAPKGNGFEKDIKSRLETLDQLRRSKNKTN